jgi:hypothetical protein
MTVLINPCYFGSVSQWLAIISADTVIFEVCDNYQKQTLRNRCNIAAANGPLSLTIPVRYTQKNREPYAAVSIANNTNWQKLHLKSLYTAYKISPFYDYYIDDLSVLYKNKWENLMAFNFKSIEIISKLLELELSQDKTQHFVTSPVAARDLRYLSAKNAKSPFKLKPYTQVFSQKHGFLSDLCILDLLFNEGPNAENFLLKHFRY